MDYCFVRSIVISESRFSLSKLSKRLHLLIIVSVMLMALVLFLGAHDAALAKNSLGIGGSEQAIKPTGAFAGILTVINDYQQDFFDRLRQALKSIKDSGAGFWVLVLLSFGYGVFHAAGPGHGKAVISSYMIANEVAAKRGIMLSFMSAMLQALTAIVIMVMLVFFLRGAGIKSGDVSGALATFSYAAITVLGAWLLWSKLKRPQNHHGHHHEHGHGLGHDHHGHSHQGQDQICQQCGHSHMPDPAMISGNLDAKGAIAAILAVGIRPCTGAIVVLAFAFLNGLYVAGIVSVFAMAIGTAITVSLLAIISVWAKDFAIWITKSHDKTAKIQRIVEILGALFVFLLGLMLLLADLYG